LITARAVLELGHSTETVTAVFDVTARCIRQWVERFNRDGHEGLRDKPKSGRPRAVPAGNIRRAAAELQKASLTPKRLREKITLLAGVRYAASCVRKMLCALGFFRRISDPVHVNASTKQCEGRYEETWRRSELGTRVCEYHGPLEGMKKRLAEYFRTARFNRPVQVFAETSFTENNTVASLTQTFGI